MVGIEVQISFDLVAPIEDYQTNYEFRKYKSESWVRQLMANQGYMSANEDTTSAYDLTNLHQSYSHER